MVLTVAILKSSLELTVSVKASTGLSPFRVTHSGAIDTLPSVKLTQNCDLPERSQRKPEKRLDLPLPLNNSSIEGMASEQTVLNVLGRAFWDPTPTGTDLRARQLAAAMGYPTTWRVVRTVDTIQGRSMIADRIYAGKPDTDCDAWFHHEAAMKVAAAWNDESSTAFSNAGGHLLPREPLFDKHDKVQVMYEGEWWDAKVLRRKTHNEGFRYQVQYVQDHSKQTGVDERLIRPRQDLNHDAFALAKQQGFGEGWQATANGKRWKIIAPDGTVYTSKKAALEAFHEVDSTPAVEEGDPPWRTTQHEYLGRSILWTTTHNISARRNISVDQVGKVVGWIAETDVDKAGLPGFVSERTKEPARLFHIKFPDDHSHPYASYLVSSQDLEEHELEGCLIPEDELPPTKKARKR
jgi:hypothetical protein